MTLILTSDNYVIVLDDAPLPYDTPETRINKIAATNANYQYMKDINSQVLHAVHGLNKKEIALSMSALEDKDVRFTFPSMFTLIARNKNSGIDPSFSNPNTFRKINSFCKSSSKITVQKLVIKRFLDFIELYKKNKYTSYVHCLGASAGLAMHIMAFTGIFVQWDSANWRVKASNAKIQLSYLDCSIPEIYMGSKEIKYGATKYKPKYDPFLMRCECPICKGLSLNERKHELGDCEGGFIHRAIHNAHHYCNELMMSRELQGTDAYFSFIEQRVAKSSPFYKMFWKGIKNLDKKQSRTTTLDAYFTNKGSKGFEKSIIPRKVA